MVRQMKSQAEPWDCWNKVFEFLSQHALCVKHDGLKERVRCVSNMAQYHQECFRMQTSLVQSTSVTSASGQADRKHLL